MEKRTFRSFLGFDKKSRKEFLKTLIVCALMVAIGVILKRFLEIPIPLFGSKSQSINFSFTIIIFSGFLFGPVWGGLVGVCSDIVSCVLFPQGPIILGITATNFFVGAFAGIFAYLFVNKYKKLWALALFCLFLSVFSSVANSFWLWLTYGTIAAKYTFWAYILMRLPFSLCLMFPINTVLLYFIMNKAVPVLEREKLVVKR